MRIAISKIRTDGGTQPRAALDFDAIEDYSEAMQAGAKFPPVTVFYDGSDYWLADGFHRIKAAWAAELEDIECDVHQGTVEDAQWYSFSANKANGLRRSNEDKQRAVKAALAHPNGTSKSDSAIAKHVGVAVQTVNSWRKQMEATFQIGKSTSRTGSDGRTINVAHIGKRKADIAQPEEQPVCSGKVAGSMPAVGSKQPSRVAVVLRAEVTPPPKPEPQKDKERITVGLLRALFDIAEHEISAGEFVSLVPPEQAGLLYEKARSAMEFTGFVMEAAHKRQGRTD